MAEQWAPAPPPKPPRRWPRWLARVGGVLAILAVVLYFFLTSHTFLDSVVLPRVSSKLGVPVTLRDSSISPFRKVALREVKIGGAAFEEPILTVQQIRARYSLRDIISGSINVRDLAIVSPVVQIIEREDGTTNLDPLLKPSAPSDAPPSGKTPQVHLRNFVLTNALVRYIKQLPGGAREIAELSGINISAANFGNGLAGALKLSSALRFERAPAPDSSSASELIEANLVSSFDVALTSDLKPDNIRGDLTLKLITPPAAAADIKGTLALLECDLTPTELRKFAITFKQGEAVLGQITAAGPLDLARKEGQIKLELASIGRHALNLVGARAGLDFGSTSLNSTHQITLASGGQITSAGDLRATRLSVSKAGAPTRPLDLVCDYSLAFDRNEKSLLLQRFTIAGEQDGTQILRGAVAGPMRLDFGAGSNVVDASSFNLHATNVNLADWRAFIGDVSGFASLGVTVNATNAGKQLAASLNAKVADATGTFGSNKIANATIALAADAALVDFDYFKLENLALRVTRAGQPAVSLLGSASGNIKTQQTIANFTIEADVRRAASLAAIEGLPEAALKLDTQVLQRGKKIDLQKLVLNVLQAGRTAATLNAQGAYDLAATNGTASLRLQSPNIFTLVPTNPAPGRPLAVDAIVSTGISGAIATLGEFNARLSQGEKVAGTVAATGKFDLEAQAGDLSLKITDLNETTLHAFVGPGKKLPATPLNAQIILAASLRNDEIVIDDFSTTLGTPNAAAGQIRLLGKYHLKSRAAEGTLSIANLNQDVLAPFATGALGEKKLSSVSINLNLAGRHDLARDAALKGDLTIDKLLLSDAAGKSALQPLALGMHLDTVLTSNRFAQIQALRLKLAPTSRARNELDLSGALNLFSSNIFSGALRLAAESLDFTPYYDMFAGTPVTNALPSQTAPPAASSARPPPAAEPPPVTLPFENFSLALNIGQLYLREMAIHHWQSTLKLDRSKVDIAQVQMLLNTAPVKGSLALNLGVPGYQYDLSLTAEKVPIAPIADTFAPDQKGKIKGDLLFASQIKGAGVTGRSLQKSLSGGVYFSVTNANLQIASPTLRNFFLPIGVMLGAPDLVNSPVSWLGGSAKLGDGKINLAEFNLVSDTFTADTQGEITIAEVLNDSPIEKWPMHISLRRSMAQRIRMVPRRTPADAAYVKLPDFVRVAGTLGAPRPELNKLALSGAVINKVIDNAVGDRTTIPNPANLLGK